MKTSFNNIKKHTLRYYDNIAINYYLDKAKIGTAGYYEIMIITRFLKKMISNFNKDEIICDLGCGSAVYTKFISQWSQFVIAVDISKNMLKTAKIKKLNFIILCDVEYLPIRSKSIDLFVSFALYEHLPNPKKVTNEMFNVLKRRGKYIIMTPNPYYPSLPFLSKIASIIKGKINEEKKQHERFLYPKELNSILKGYMALHTGYMWVGLPLINVFTFIPVRIRQCFLEVLFKIEQEILCNIPLIRNLGYLQLVYGGNKHA